LLKSLSTASPVKAASVIRGDLGDQGADRGEIGAVLRGRGAAFAGEAVDRPVLLVEDNDPVVMEALGHEHADLEVEPGRVEGRAAALRHHLVPPGDAAQLGERAGEPGVDRIVDKLGLRADDILVHLAGRIEDDGDHHRADDEHQAGHGHDEAPGRGDSVLFAGHCHSFAIFRRASSGSGLTKY